MTTEDEDHARVTALQIVGEFSALFPKISLPYQVWDLLKEMIEWECMGRYGGADLSAEQLADHPVTKHTAAQSGLGADTQDVGSA